MPSSQSRVPNWKIDQLLKGRVPFSNYNQTIIATLDSEGIYSVTHWRTEIVRWNVNTERLVSFDPGAYSQTTSTLQGRIVRNLLTPSAVENLYSEYAKHPETKPWAKKLSRLARMR